jgi:hypothetical protein
MEKKQRWTEVIKNKEAALQERHRRFRDNFNNQVKLDKEKLKK